jgi:hypothetical protein
MFVSIVLIDERKQELHSFNCDIQFFKTSAGETRLPFEELKLNIHGREFQMRL